MPETPNDHREGTPNPADPQVSSIALSLLSEINAFAAISEPRVQGSWPDGGAFGDGNVIYLSFLRTGAAVNDEIGTPLKQIAFLPHLRRIGITVLLTLPTGRIGQANRKGTRGSPFAVADPFTLDRSLIDPLIPCIDQETQYRALIQACELLGIRCGSIIPAATLALDSPLIGSFPEITYWWDLPPGTALRPTSTAGDSSSGIPQYAAGIDPVLNARFADPPPARTVARETHSGVAFWRSESGLTPATACPDVLAGDSGTYSWADVAGIRFSASLAPNVSTAETQAVPGGRAVQLAALAIAWRAAVLGERLFWVDVAARVPPAVLELACTLYGAWDSRADQVCAALASEFTAGSGERIGELLDNVVQAALPRQSRRQLAFIAEELYSFRSSSSLHDAVVGPWIYCVAPFGRDLPTLRNSIRHHIAVLADGGSNCAFLTGLGDHDTCPPAPEIARGLLVLSWLLPGSIPMIFSGHEHSAQVVINKEFGFNTTPQLRDWRSRLGDDTLALFNDVAMPWENLQQAHDLTTVIQRLLRIRASLRTQSLTQMQLLDSPGSGEHVTGYRRTTPTGDGLDVYINTSPVTTHNIDTPRGWRLVYSTCSYPAARPPDDKCLPPLAAAVYASSAIATQIANDQS